MVLFFAVKVGKAAVSKHQICQHQGDWRNYNAPAKYRFSLSLHKERECDCKVENGKDKQHGGPKFIQLCKKSISNTYLSLQENFLYMYMFWMFEPGCVSCTTNDNSAFDIIRGGHSSILVKPYNWLNTISQVVVRLPWFSANFSQKISVR